MNPNEQLSRTVKKKSIILDRYRTSIEKFGITIQSDTIDALMEGVIGKLTIKNGRILNTTANIRALSELDRNMSRLRASYQEMINLLGKGFGEIQKLNGEYFSIAANKSKEIIKKASKASVETLNMRLGIGGNGNLLQSGWLPNLIADTTVLEGVRQILFKNVLSQAKFTDTIKTLKEYVEGTPEKGGAYDRYMKNTLYDIYQQYDAAYSLSMANQLGLRYFIYEGGLVEDSRDFCREHNGHVYTTENAEGWATWVPADSIHIDTFKQKDEYSIPSYLGYPGYNPLIDRGGYNCRHQLSYISDGIAKLMMEKEE